jgi:hypothetical protein
MPRKYNPKSKENLKPFKPGFDERRNLKGKPKSFDQLRDFLQSIAQEEIKDGNEVKTRIRQIAEAMMSDKRLMKDFLEFAYGKVPLSQIIKVDEHSDISWSDFINGYGSDTDAKSGSDKS